MLIGWCTGICSAGIELAAWCGSQQVSSSSTFSAPGTEERDVGPHDRQRWAAFPWKPREKTVHSSFMRWNKSGLQVNKRWQTSSGLQHSNWSDWCEVVRTFRTLTRWVVLASDWTCREQAEPRGEKERTFNTWSRASARKPNKETGVDRLETGFRMAFKLVTGGIWLFQTGLKLGWI